MTLQTIRSKASLEPAYVQFINGTENDVIIFWIDFHGKHVFYSLLQSGLRCKVNTYRNHPWIFRDTLTGEKMHVAHQEIFWPKPCFIKFRENLQHKLPCRRKFLIHSPLRTLRDTCIWYILKTPQISGDLIDKLPIPQGLKRDLKSVFAGSYLAMSPYDTTF